MTHNKGIQMKRNKLTRTSIFTDIIFKKINNFKNKISALKVNQFAAQPARISIIANRIHT